MNNFNIREANENDTDAVLELMDQQVKYHLSLNPDYKEDIPPEYSENKVIKLINSNDDLFLVADLDGSIAGYFIAGTIKKPKQDKITILDKANKSIFHKARRKLIRKVYESEDIRYIQTGFIKDCYVVESHRNKSLGSRFLEKGMLINVVPVQMFVA